MMGIQMKVQLGSLELENPVMIASGTGGYGLEMERWIDISRPGAIVVKGLSPEPRLGNPPPRIVETASGLLNSIGLENIGVEKFVREVIPALEGKGATVLGNVYGTSVKEFVLVSRKIEEAGGVAALELNLSCPNVKAGGLVFGRDPVQSARVIAAVKEAVDLPVLAKLTPSVSDITQPALACEEAGADALTVANSYPGMAVNLETGRPVLGQNFGGLAGPCIKPLALRLVWEASQAVNIPVVGCGGITTWQDALEFVIAGAHAIQIGTANLVNPLASLKIIDGIREYLHRQGMDSVSSIRGTLRLNS
jgi:dihydroorotate dehydrogenase (NAD+) catalytic subunit